MATKYQLYVLDPVTRQYQTIAGASSTDGTSSYDDLENVPIKNVTGNDQNAFVNIAGLTLGHYNVSGYYKLDNTSELLNTNTCCLDMIITMDSETNDRVAVYDIVENNDVFTYVITYHGTLVKTIKKIDHEPTWGSF